MTKKKLLLTLLFVLPLVIFGFLFSLGDNKFEVPVLYQSEESQIPCQESIEFPFFVDLNNWQVPEKSFLVAIFWPTDEERIRDARTEWERIIEKTSGIPFKAIIFAQSSENSAIVPTGMNGVSEIKTMEISSLETSRSCDWLMKKDIDITLVDGQGRIRGQYKLGNRAETDRFSVELEILNNNKEYE